MMLKCVLKILFIVYLWTTIVASETLILKTKLGNVEGKIMKSRKETSFYGFRGIRFAEPPIGDLRFKDPIPVNPWQGTFDATDDGPICPQLNALVEISEDCLRINVYTKQVPMNDTQVLKPVIVYIPGGGFVIGGGNSKFLAGPEYLMDYDIVFVSFNYRLGTLGFLSTGTKDSPGNYGFKDQVQALRWVKENIAEYGGNPNSVTILGQSAGGFSITYHLVSSMSHGLFHKAIAMSGAGTAHWKVPNNQLAMAQKQASLFGCHTENPTEIVTCLRNVSALDLCKLEEFVKFAGCPLLMVGPVIEDDFGQERFLIEEPTKLVQSGRFQKVPMLIGITKDEFTGLALQVLNNDHDRHEMDIHFELYAPICFSYEPSQNISLELKKAYIHKPLEMDGSLEELGQLFSDSTIIFGVHRFVHLAANFTTIFYYKSSYVGRYSFFYYPEDKPYGNSHTDDLLYILGHQNVSPIFKVTDPENLTVERMTRMWTNFATNGDPNNENDEIIGNLRWTPFSEAEENYLDIGNELVMRNNLYTERLRIWERLFPIN